MKALRTWYIGVAYGVLKTGGFNPQTHGRKHYTEGKKWKRYLKVHTDHE